MGSGAGMEASAISGVPILNLLPRAVRQVKAGGRLPSPRESPPPSRGCCSRTIFPSINWSAWCNRPGPGRPLAQSGQCGELGPVATLVALRRAIVALGALRGAGSGGGIFLAAAPSGRTMPRIRLRWFWSRSLATAIACQDLASEAQIAAGEFHPGPARAHWRTRAGDAVPAAYGQLLASRPGEAALNGAGGRAFRLRPPQPDGEPDDRLGPTELLIRAAYHHESPRQPNSLADRGRTTFAVP